MKVLNMNKENSLLKSIIKSLILGVMIALLIVMTIVPLKIKGYSMEPTLINGQYIIVNKIDKSFKIGDIIVFHIYDKEYLVKRVIALEGDDLEINNGQVYVNGVRLEESYVKEPWYDGIYSGIIPDGHIFGMGDNRNDSIDSRNIGAIKKSKVLGKIMFK